MNATNMVQGNLALKLETLQNPLLRLFRVAAPAFNL